MVIRPSGYDHPYVVAPVIRCPLTFLLILCVSAPLAGQSGDGNRHKPGGTGSTPIELPPGADTTAIPGEVAVAIWREGVEERIVGGAIVGAVTGAVLSAQGSDCAPARSTGRSSFVGAVWGALRGALKAEDTNELPLPDSRDNGGEEGPFPFDGENCQRADND
jgi:hypothetical protein